MVKQGGPGSPPLLSCTIITREADPPVRTLHGRMPVIPAPEYYQAWLDHTEKDPETLLRMLHHENRRRIIYYPLSKAVNPAGINTPSLITPLKDLPAHGPESG